MMIDDREYLRPPDNEGEKITECCECGEEIFVGEEYYNIGGNHYCELCIDQFVIIRAGSGLKADKLASRNMDECERLGFRTVCIGIAML